MDAALSVIVEFACAVRSVPLCLHRLQPYVDTIAPAAAQSHSVPLAPQPHNTNVHRQRRMHTMRTLYPQLPLHANCSNCLWCAPTNNATHDAGRGSSSCLVSAAAVDSAAAGTCEGTSNSTHGWSTESPSAKQTAGTLICCSQQAGQLKRLLHRPDKQWQPHATAANTTQHTRSCCHTAAIHIPPHPTLPWFLAQTETRLPATAPLSLLFLLPPVVAAAAAPLLLPAVRLRSLLAQTACV